MDTVGHGKLVELEEGGATAKVNEVGSCPSKHDNKVQEEVDREYT